MDEDFQYAPLDFSSIMGEKFAVHCQTEEDAKHFCAEIKRQFGKWFYATSRCTDGLETHWSMYGETTAYSPYLHDADERMTYCSVDHYLKYKYVIVPFDDLKITPELDEFEVDEINISALFEL